MSKHCTDAGQGCTFTEHGHGGGMAKNVRTVDGRFDPGPAQRSANDVGNSRPCERVKRSENRSEHLGRLQRWPTLIHVEQNRIANLLR